ncbi:DUF4203 domain-containing protein [bacterium]|nr:DUF4203 domain-containing protein [candidate division CSSED10-310 bacterium]
MVQLHHISLPATQIIGILFGSVNCFFGYRIFRILIGIWGFFTGITSGMWISDTMGFYGIGKWIITLLLGIIGAALVSLLYFAGVFLLGALFGYFILNLTAVHLHLTLSWIWIAVCSLLGGLAALGIQKPILILGTAYTGAWLAVISALSYLLNKPPWMIDLPGDLPQTTQLFSLISWLAIGTLGMAFQAKGVKSALDS